MYGPVVGNETGGVREIQKEVLSTLFSKHPKLKQSEVRTRVIVDIRKIILTVLLGLGRD